MYVNLDLLKNHLNIEPSFKDDDELIMTYEGIAEQAIERHIDYYLSDIAANNGGELPSPLAAAIMLYVGNLYSNREAVTFGTPKELPLSYSYLLDLYKNYNGNTKLFN